MKRVKLNVSPKDKPPKVTNIKEDTNAPKRFMTKHDISENFEGPDIEFE